MGKIRVRTDIPGPRSREVVAEEQRHLAPGLQAFATWAGVAMASGQGSTLTDVDGNTYVDLIGGIGVNALGHCHPRHVEAIASQAWTLVVGSFTSEPRAALVNAVCELAPSGLDRLQLYSSGTEAVESALRLARCATGRTEVLGFWGGFHGKTAGAAALLGSSAREALGPLPAGATLVPYADCYRCPLGLARESCGLACAELARKAMKAQAAGPLAAVVFEPMQGTAGNVIPPDGFLPAIADAAREAGALLVADEMITGFGRTGRPWGVDHSGVRPDIATVGKGFGSGFPISGVLARDAVSRAKPWSNPSGASSSYGGNALAAAAALASVTTISEERLWENAARVGSAMVAELRRMQERHPFIGDVRGAGLFIGVELVKDRATKEPLDAAVTRHVYEECLRRGLLAMTYTPHVRLQPALTIDADTALEGLSVLDAVFAELARGGRWR
ncbi:aspartate aminotransferase family protein [Anaeromyxobacter oryzae]|uniref:Acetylornithine aminotransferase n=1 Tax=Anaeromyxobacter oryzae TaxID=2918170 RepID=A0ABN6MWD5_9BACT|nr:aspartate aminotransferase family protein [Anaeromyxobacter oryzae]BDG03823.1 acetylornithine aminotransferase [Anaeromyxobacter oryzae]